MLLNWMPPLMLFAELKEQAKKRIWQNFPNSGQFCNRILAA